MAAAAPDIGSLLASLGGAPAGPPPGPPQGGSEAEPIRILKQMISLANQYLGVEPDEEDKATMAKLLATLQQYLAKDQKDQDQMLGGLASPRGLRKALGS